MIKEASELSLCDSKSPVPTVELDLDSLPENIYGYDDLVFTTLSRLAKNKDSLKATVYVYQGPSVNFHEQSFSAFFGVAGNQTKRVLESIYSAFKPLAGVKCRYSDYIKTSDGICEFHVENGIAWRPSDATTWHTNDGQQTEGEESAEGLDALSIRSDEQLMDEPGQKGDLDLPKQVEDPLRYRAARADAKVGSIKRKIEKLFDLPEGSVALCGPDGNPLRSDAKVSTLRQRWE